MKMLNFSALFWSLMWRMCVFGAGGEPYSQMLGTTFPKCWEKGDDYLIILLHGGPPTPAQLLASVFPQRSLHRMKKKKKNVMWMFLAFPQMWTLPVEEPDWGTRRSCTFPFSSSLSFCSKNKKSITNTSTVHETWCGGGQGWNSGALLLISLSPPYLRQIRMAKTHCYCNNHKDKIYFHSWLTGALLSYCVFSF